MIVRTCLLISDDPDDHVEFSEALYEISDDAVLVAVSDAGKALELLRQRKYLPEFVFLNLGISAFDPDAFMEVISSAEHLSKLKVIAFGDSVSSSRFSTYFSNELSFSQLKQTLRSILA